MSVAVDKLLGLENQTATEFSFDTWSHRNYLHTERLIFVGIAAAEESELADYHRIGIFGDYRQREPTILTDSLKGIVILVEAHSNAGSGACYLKTRINL